MKIKFVEGTLIPEVDKYHFDLQTEKNGKKNVKLILKYHGSQKLFWKEKGIISICFKLKESIILHNSCGPLVH